MYDAIFQAIPVVFSIKSLLLMFLGTGLGIAIGAMPGLTASMGVALLIPLTFGMPPAYGLVLLGSIYCGAIYGGSISAILLNVPGTPSSAATVLDGFPMTQRGEADKALKISTTASFTGGIISAFVLLFLAPPLARIALMFGASEYFWLALLGLSVIVSLSSANIVKGFLAAAFGLFVGSIGLDSLTGVPRFTFGVPNLLD
ncbi:MAG TPA: tripartite tricarboxylate transporter permease, partial [Clostridiales bacterium]|nr:tripartite tricarboxylate transporter permease [Clostridiales bacterium]